MLYLHVLRSRLVSNVVPPCVEEPPSVLCCTSMCWGAGLCPMWYLHVLMSLLVFIVVLPCAEKPPSVLCCTSMCWGAHLSYVNCLLSRHVLLRNTNTEDFNKTLLKLFCLGIVLHALLEMLFRRLWELPVIMYRLHIWYHYADYSELVYIVEAYIRQTVNSFTGVNAMTPFFPQAWTL